MRFGLEHMQQPKGSSIYLRLSTRSLAQPERTLSAQQQDDIVSGGYWYVPPARDADIAIGLQTDVIGVQPNVTLREFVERFMDNYVDHLARVQEPSKPAPSEGGLAA